MEYTNYFFFVYPGRIWRRKCTFWVKHDYYIRAMAEKEHLKTMEEAKDGVPEEVKAKLGKMWAFAKTTEHTDKDVEYFRIGKVSDRLNEAISVALEFEVKAEMQYIRLKDVRHIDEAHGLGNEKKPEQMPVTEERFMLLMDVLKSFDTVRKGTDTAFRKSVKIMKNYLDGRIVIADAVLRDGNLAITGMFIKKPATDSA